MGIASFRAKADLARHIAQTQGTRALGRQLSVFARQWARLARAKLVYPDVVWGNDVVVRGVLELCGPGRVIIGDRCVFDGASGVPNRISVMSPDAIVELGADVYMNGATLLAERSIRIGELSLVGTSMITDSDFHLVDRDRRIPHGKGLVRPVVIGENVWIGGSVTILKGVTLGRDTVVGAGTVVRHSVPAGKLVIGNPEQAVRDIDGDRRTEDDC